MRVAGLFTRLRAPLASIAWALLTTAPGFAQVGDISGVTYPGWIPSDGVRPVVTTDVTYDPATGLWEYDYTLANAADAEQAIIKIWLRFDAPQAADVQLTAPAGWWGALLPGGGGIPGAAFGAERLDEVGDVWPPAPAQIAAGASLSGFHVTSLFPPGEARTYVQGYAAIPFLPDGFDAETNVPHDTTNSQRGWSAGPTQYGEVITFGRGQRGDVNQFIGFLDLDAGMVRHDPAPIALKLAATVDPATFHAELNGVDVTAAFVAVTTGGADRVAFFEVGSSPLALGRNVLVVSIDGTVPGTTRTGTDRDRIAFTVEP